MAETRDTDGRPSAGQHIRFRDPSLQRHFHQDGFVRVPLMNRSELRTLQALWTEIAPDAVTGIYSNVHDLDADTNRHVDATVAALLEPYVDELFFDAVLGGSSFLVKGTGPDSASTLHQDWNVVEESIAQSASIWIPLVDVDETNGALQVLPGSHRCRPSIRSLDTPSLYLDFTSDIEPLLECIHASAGDAVVYMHNLFHGSKPNLSGSTRVSVASGLLNIGSRLVHYRRTPDLPDGSFDVLELDRDFFFSGIESMKAGAVPSTARIVDRTHNPHFQLTYGDVVGRRVTSQPTAVSRYP